MDSFYGGKQGASFVIKGHFKYISTDSPAYIIRKDYIESNLAGQGDAYTEAMEELAASTMIECFKDANYKDVWYNEYCIIDAPNKSDKDNGKIFRRTLKGVGDTPVEGGYAEYIGQITGPAGPTPTFEIGSLNKVRTDWAAEQVDGNDYIKYYAEGSDGSPVEKHTKEVTDTLYTFTAADGANIQFIPGNTIISGAAQDVQYVDTLKYNWYEFTDAYDETDTPAKVHIGFEVPYYMATFERGQALNYTELPYIEEDESTQGSKAPFYDKYIVSIPRGITGGYIGEIQQYIKEENVTLYKPTAIKHVARDDSYTINTADTFTPAAGAEVWIGYFHYNTPTGLDIRLPNPIYLGYTKDIKNIALAADGTLTIDYTDTTTTTFEKTLNWITKVAVENDKLVIDTNNDNITNITQNLHIIKNVELAHDGTITITYSDSNGRPQVLTETLGWIDSVSIDENKNLIIESNNENILPTITQNLHVITNIELQGDATPENQGTTNQIKITYSDGTTELVGDDVNYIQDTYVSSPGDSKLGANHEGYHLFVLFNAASHRETGEGWVDLNGDGLYWKDLGYLRKIDQGVILQTKVVTNREGVAGVVSYMNENYPGGLQGLNAGKLVAAEASNGTTYLTAYDYENEEWFSIGSLSSSLLDAVLDGTGLPYDTNSLHLIPWTEIPHGSPMGTPWGQGNDGTDPEDILRYSTIGAAQGADMINDMWYGIDPETNN